MKIFLFSFFGIFSITSLPLGVMMTLATWLGGNRGLAALSEPQLFWNWFRLGAIQWAVLMSLICAFFYSAVVAFLFYPAKLPLSSELTLNETKKILSQSYLSSTDGIMWYKSKAESSIEKYLFFEPSPIELRVNQNSLYLIGPRIDINKASHKLQKKI